MRDYEPDFILRTIRQFASILRRIVSNIQQGQTDLAENEILDALQNEFGITAALRQYISTSEMLAAVQVGSAYDRERLLYLAELLKMLGSIQLQRAENMDAEMNFLQSLELHLAAQLQPDLQAVDEAGAMLEQVLSLIAPELIPAHILLDLVEYDLRRRDLKRAGRHFLLAHYQCQLSEKDIYAFIQTLQELHDSAPANSTSFNLTASEVAALIAELQAD